MIRIAIVEDDAHEREKLHEYLTCFAQDDGLLLEIDCYPSGIAFVMGKMEGYDIILMDIDMPVMNGLEAAHKLREVDQSAVLVFVTNMAQFAVSGYEVDALDFVIKPVTKVGFMLKMRRALSRTAKKNDDVFSVKADNTLYRVQISSVRYVEVSGHYVTYHTAGGIYTEYATLKDVNRRLRSPCFVQCNQSFLVNMKYITSVTREKVVVDDTEIFISRKMRSAFLESFSEFCGGGLM